MPGSLVEPGAIGGDDRRCLGSCRAAQPGQRVDIEGPDDGGVQAAEIEGHDVLEQPGPGGDDAAPRGPVERVLVGAQRRGHDAPLVQVFHVEELERGNAHPCLLEGGADEKRLGHGEVQQALLLQDLQDQPGILEAVGAEGGGILAVQPGDGLARRLVRALGDGVLAPAEKRLRDGLQPVVLQPHARQPHQPQRVQHLPAGHDGLAPLPPRDPVVILAGEEGGGRVRAADVEGQAEVGEPPGQDPDVEVHDVPSRDDVGVEIDDPAPRLEQHFPLAGEGAHGRRGPGRAGTGREAAGGRRPSRVEKNLLHGAARARVLEREAHGIHGSGFRVCLDVQGQSREGRGSLRGDYLGILVDPAHPSALPP